MMIKRLLIIVVIILLIVIFLPFMKNVILKDSLNELSSGYVEKSVSDLKTANIVTQLL